MKDVLVVGAGPAGMMAAITAAENGARVTLLEKMQRVGRKMLITGKGRCNLTNARRACAGAHPAVQGERRVPQQRLCRL